LALKRRAHPPFPEAQMQVFQGMALGLAMGLSACGGKVDVVRTVSPADARVSGLAPMAIVRD
jgi:hypothetical protein